MLNLRAILGVLLLLGAPAIARAAEEDGQVDLATQDLVQQGIQLRRSGKDEAALRAFLDAEARSPSSVRVLLHVTAAAQATGRWLLAHQYLQKAAQYRSDPYYQRHRASVQAVEDAVAQRVGQLRVIGTPSGAEVLINGEVVGTLPMDGPRPLVVGSYLLEVRKPGYFSVRRPFEIVGGAHPSQEAVELKPAPPARGATGAARTSGGAKPIGETPAGRSTSPLRARWVTFALAGTGVALMATSGVAFAIREHEASRWNDDERCLDGANPSRTRQQLCADTRSDAKTAERVGIVTGVLGLGLGGAALAHWLSTSERENEHAGGLPACDIGLGSVACRGTF
jgi:hypothetical protein